MKRKQMIQATIFVVGAVIASLAAWYLLKDKCEKAPPYLYKIVTESTYTKSLNHEKLELPAFDDAFIHLATEEQISKIRQKFFADEAIVYVLKLDTKRLPGRLVKEKNPGGQTEYYHLYDGFIPQSAVVSKVVDVADTRADI